jgi:AcrR family transcriptional regulator
MSQPLPRADGLPAGLRERKKLRTRLAIQEQAHKLFRELGYVQTTVEQIAEAAEVSPSTFFRYFPTKEDVVLFDAFDPVLIEAYRRQPASLGPVAAFRRAAHEVFGAMEAETVADQRERGRLVHEVPELQSAWMADVLRTARQMAGLVAERTGRDPEDPEVLMFTGAFIGAMMAALLPLLASEEADFVGSMDAALDFLERGLTLGEPAGR